MGAVSLGHVVTAHLNRVYSRAYGTSRGSLGPVLDWVNDYARTEPDALRLPVLSCDAAGGDPIQAIPVSAAWHLLHCAARLLDDVADEAPLSLAPGQVVNAAVVLIFLAQLSLTTLGAREAGSDRPPALGAERAIALVNTFNMATARMALGQHADLTWDEQSATLDDYWRVVGDKTGEFFALACRAGAMLGTEDPSEIEVYSTFGYHLGILVQLGDDLQAIWKPRGRGDLTTAARTLPVVYMLNVTSGASREHLRELVRRAPDDPEALRELQAVLAGNAPVSGEPWGALHYLTLQAGKQHHLARDALLSSTRPAVAQNELMMLLDAAFPAVSPRSTESRPGCSTD